MASACLPSIKPAHVVSPMNGGIFQPSTVTGRSLRGAVTLNTPSVAFQDPGSPVIWAIRFVSRAASAVGNSRAARASTGRNLVVLMVFEVWLNVHLLPKV